MQVLKCPDCNGEVLLVRDLVVMAHAITVHIRVSHGSSSTCQKGKLRDALFGQVLESAAKESA